MKIQLPHQVEDILTKLNSSGYEAFVVGGCVRDYIMGITPHDWDICTSALPAQTIGCFKGFTIIETGLQHGTVTLLLDNTPYEITTYRIDGEYSDHRHPDSVLFTPDIYNDLARRDFTINAIAYSPKDGFIDPFAGIDSIKKKEIRCVGNARQRFAEDALRILRALRFASRLGFAIEEDTKEAITAQYSLLEEISVERIAQEFIQILMGPHVREVLLQYPKIIAGFIPEIQPMFHFNQYNPHHRYDIWEHTVRTVSASKADERVRLAAFFHDIGKPESFTLSDGVGHFYGHQRAGADLTKNIMRRMRFSNALIEDVGALVYYHDASIEPKDKSIRRWLNRLGEKLFSMLLEVKRADAIGQGSGAINERLKEIDEIEAILMETIDSSACFQLKDLAVGGKDLIAMGFLQGKEIGALLDILLELVMEGKIENDKKDLLCFAKQFAKEKGVL